MRPPLRHAVALPDTAEAMRRENEDKTALLEALAHDLRTPVTTVLGAAITLQRDGDGLNDEIRARLLGSIVSSARTMVRLLDDLLDDDRIAHGALELDLREIDVLDAL